MAGADSRSNRTNVGEKITTGEGACHAHSKADGDGEEAEQNQIDRVLLVVVVQRAKHCTHTKIKTTMFISLASSIHGQLIAVKFQGKLQLGQVRGSSMQNTENFTRVNPTHRRLLPQREGTNTCTHESTQGSSCSLSLRV